MLRIDALLEQMSTQPAATSQQADFNKTILYAQLYHAVDGWLKERARGVGNAGRENAVQALYLIVCKILALRVNVTINWLPQWLSAAFGRDLSRHGEKLDYESRFAQYLSSTDRAKYRIHFNGGIAQQMQWWLNNTKVVNADSKNGYVDNLGWRAGHAGYALSLGGDFFSGLHIGGAPGQGTNFYHSSYMGGDTVRCAGTWKIVNGKLLEITDSSGHYQPTIQHMLGCIETLKGHGVDLSDVKIFLMSQGNPAPEFTLAEFMVAAQRMSLGAMADAFNANRTEQQVRIAKQVAANYKADALNVARRIAELETVTAHLRDKRHPQPDGKLAKSAGYCALCNNHSKEWPAIIEQLAKDKAQQAA